MMRASLLWVLMAALIGCASTSDTEPASAQSAEARYFESPQQAVPRIATMLRNNEWDKLARFYDLSDASIDRAQLTSGQYFVAVDTTAQELPPPEKELAQYRHPFHPSFEYVQTVDTEDERIVMVRLVLEIEQGGSMPPRRTFDTFRMKRHAEGWQILPAESG